MKVWFGDLDFGTFLLISQMVGGGVCLDSDFSVFTLGINH